MTTSASGSLGRFLTLADASEILNTGLEAVDELVRSGELPAIRVGARGPWRIERDVLESYIDAMYEQSRRESLWHQSDLGNITELAGIDGAEG